MKLTLWNDAHSEYYRQDCFGTRYEQIQILTVEDLLEGKGIIMPQTLI